MTVLISPLARQQFMDANGNPLVGGKLFTYAANSNTKLATYTSSDGSTPNTNPIILDSSGRTPYGLWLTSGVSYKYVLAPSTDTDPPTSAIYTEDYIQASSTNAITTTNQWNTTGLVPSYINATSFSITGDVTVEHHIGRRIKSLVSSGYVYSTITNAVFSAGTTTITIRNDSGVLDAGLSQVDLSALTFTNHAVPNVYAPIIYGKNLLINPQFTINQREVTGTVVLAAGVYGHDRWKAGASGCTYTYNGVNNINTVNITAGSLLQAIESNDTTPGTNPHVLTWSGTAQGRVDSGSYGNSGLSASVTGGTVVLIEFGTGTLSDVQFEKGIIPTSHEYRPMQVELDLCQRYFEVIRTATINQGVASGVATSGTTASVVLTYKTKRNKPTITFSAGWLGADGASNAASTLTTQLVGFDRATLGISMVATIACRAVVLNCDAVGRTITLNSEL